ncbi:hypothetical protein CRENPOLYSF2_420032 [Crenothrix polyspora]|uniref:Uncharacterized protein n=1 Tax=Crenothrix polyspora TaxID=360316 RepID=A0A1R4HES0_9GAMM|nr:hypothetical protein CRENPOLYSF2_420032 [Crenothrix polyspora]
MKIFVLFQFDDHENQRLRFKVFTAKSTSTDNCVEQKQCC